MDQLSKVNALNEERLRNAKVLEAALKDEKNIGIPLPPENTKPVYLNYVIQVPEDKREEIMRRMIKRGIDLGFGFLNSCADMDEFRLFRKDCPLSNKLVRTNLYLPLHPPLVQRHMERIALNLKGILDESTDTAHGQ